MSKQQNRRSTRARSSITKFGIDDYTQLEKCYTRKSGNQQKCVSIDLSSNSSNEDTNHSTNSRLNLRSKNKISGELDETNGKSSEKLSKPKTIKKVTKQVNGSTPRRALRSTGIEVKVKNKLSNDLNDTIVSQENEDTKVNNGYNDVEEKVPKLLILNKRKVKKVEQSFDSLSLKKRNKMPKMALKKAKMSGKKALEYALKRLHSSSIPESLPCRETHFNDIYNYVESKLNEGIGGCMYISGVPGTGKTATVYEVKRKLETKPEFEFKFIEINGLRLSEPHQCYSQILYELKGKKYSSYNSMDALNDRFCNEDPENDNEFVILLVDELDLLRTPKQDILYNLFDWPTKPFSKLIILSIANAMDLPEKVMINRVSSRLGLTRLTFHPYSYRDLETIVSSRLADLGNVFDSDALQLICRKVAAVSGDARRALDISRRSVELAQLADDKSVTMKHVDEALQEIFNSLKVNRIRNASLHEKILLQSIAQEFRISGLEEALFIDIYKHHIEMCRFEGHYCLSTGELAKVAYNLHSIKLIILENSSSGLFRRIRLNVSVADIDFALKM